MVRCIVALSKRQLVIPWRSFHRRAPLLLYARTPQAFRLAASNYVSSLRPLSVGRAVSTVRHLTPSTAVLVPFRNCELIARSAVRWASFRREETRRIERFESSRALTCACRSALLAPSDSEPMQTTFNFAPARSCETASSQSSLKPERAGVTFIYGLHDPVTGELRYIGKADDPEARLIAHIRDCTRNTKREKNRKANWIRSILAKGLKPVIEVIDEVSQVEWKPAESAYILFYKEAGARLVNATLGGEGYGAGKDHPMFGKRVSPEAAARLRVLNKGRKHSAQTRAKMSVAGLRRKPPTVETRAKLSTSSKGHGCSPETRAKMSAAQARRKPPTAETRAKLSAASKGRKLAAETVAKIAAANTGKKRSAEVREKIREDWVKRRLLKPWCSRRERRRWLAFLL